MRRLYLLIYLTFVGILLLFFVLFSSAGGTWFDSVLPRVSMIC